NGNKQQKLQSKEATSQNQITGKQDNEDQSAEAESIEVQSTRLFVNNLPSKTTEADLRRLFQPIPGQLTDVQLKFAPDGKFRRFAFVGFRSAESASAALKQLNGAFVGASRVQIMPCRPLPSRCQNSTEQSVAKKDLKVKVKSKTATPVSAVDDDELADEEPSKSSTGVLSGQFVVKLKGCPPGIQARTIREFFAPLPVQKVKIARTGCAYARLSTESDAQTAVSVYNKRNMGKKKVLVRRVAAESVETQPVTPSSSSKPKSTRASCEIEEKILDTGRLFARNLPYDIAEAELRTLFEPFGEVSELHLSYQSLLKRNKGFAFVSYLFPEHALKAYTALDGTDFMGRNLHLLPADGKPEDEDAELAEAKKSRQAGERPMTAFQRKKAAELRASSGTHLASWNALFLGADTVANLVSQQLGEAKANLLFEGQRAGSDGASVAVRLAHGEADLVAQTRRFLEENGVNLDSFGQRRPGSDERSDRVFLSVLGLEISWRRSTPRFPGFEKLVLPPTHGVTGLVAYATPQEARTAYRRTAFTRFVDRPLYLEWAPVGCLDQENKKQQEKAEATTDKQTQDEADQPTANKVLIRNVAFQANSKELRALLAPFGEIVGSVRLPRKPEGGHRGFAFAQFVSAESARRAVEQLSGSAHLYGRRLLLEFSGGDEGDGDGTGKQRADVETLRRRAVASVEAERAAKKRSRLVLDGGRNDDDGAV
uniref:RNA-binding protein 19 n=1 Tax=Macrostomum lignano TaxID=282301 RepID=A0A1I8GWV3_9PLAT